MSFIRALSGAIVSLALFASAAAAQDAGPSRVVAIGGSLLEVVYALGEEDRLVARDSTGLYPQEASALPDVGYMRALSPEGVMSVNPDLILMLEGSGPPEAVDVIQKSSIEVITIPDGFDREGVLQKIEMVGEALGAQERAAQVAKEVAAELDAAAALTADIAERRRVLFILSVQGGRILASGSDTAADGIIRLAGAVNAVEGFTGYKHLSEEALYKANPDVVLMMSRGGEHGTTADELFSHPALAATAAGANKRLIRMDGGWLLGFGPRTASATRELAGELYGNAAGE